MKWKRRTVTAARDRRAARASVHDVYSVQEESNPHLLRLHALDEHPVEEGHDRSNALDGKRLQKERPRLVSKYEHSCW